jgi:2-polyprenyl-3-methyl-5-hydroxy-6-metoxy-1,4-benzoquinol methylase
MDIKTNSEEEIFCLKFELDYIAEHLIHGNAERWLHKFMSPFGEILHVNRYEFGKKYIKDKIVLDVAGGCGYGTFLLANEGDPKEVHSVDLSESSVRYANYRYPHPKINRITSNAESYTNKDYFDVIISYETIEHLKGFNAFLEKVHNSLKPGGLFIVSTPVTNKTTTNNLNPYHVIEWSFHDFQKLIENKFKIGECYIQNITLKHQVVKSFYSRVLYKLFPDRYKTFNPNLIKFQNQIDPNNIVSGFQILVCSKK